MGSKEKPRDFWKAQGLGLLKDRNFFRCGGRGFGGEAACIGN
jgi:hypothetical protein